LQKELGDNNNHVELPDYDGSNSELGTEED